MKGIKNKRSAQLIRKTFYNKAKKQIKQETQMKHKETLWGRVSADGCIIKNSCMHVILNGEKIVNLTIIRKRILL